MPMEALWPCHTHDAFVAVTAYDNGIMDGSLFHPRLGSPRSIKSVSQLVSILDQAQKLENMPCRPDTSAGEELGGSHRIASFTIQVLFQQNHTIQGKLIWHEQAMEAAFSSALELIYLLDDILTAQTVKAG